MGIFYINFKGPNIIKKVANVIKAHLDGALLVNIKYIFSRVEVNNLKSLQ